MSATRLMISSIIEPQNAFAARQAMPKPLASVMTAREITKNPPKIYDPKPADDYWITLIFETVGDNGDDPLR